MSVYRLVLECALPCTMREYNGLLRFAFVCRTSTQSLIIQPLVDDTCVVITDPDREPLADFRAALSTPWDPGRYWIRCSGPRSSYTIANYRRHVGLPDEPGTPPDLDTEPPLDDFVRNIVRTRLIHPPDTDLERIDPNRIR